MGMKNYSKNFLDPSDDFVGGGVGGLVQIDYTVFQVFLDGTVKRGGGHRDGGVMRCSNIQLVIILDKGVTLSNKGHSEALYLGPSEEGVI